MCWKEFKRTRNSEECKTCVTKQPNEANDNNQPGLRGILPFLLLSRPFINRSSAQLIRSVLILSVQSSIYSLSPQFIRSVLKLSVQSSTYPLIPPIIRSVISLSFSPQLIRSVLNLSVKSSNYPVSPQLIR